MRAPKRIFNLARDFHAGAILERETEEQLAIFGATNQLEAFQANTERRPPKFADLKAAAPLLPKDVTSAG